MRYSEDISGGFRELLAGFWIIKRGLRGIFGGFGGLQEFLVFLRAISVNFKGFATGFWSVRGEFSKYQKHFNGL